MFAVACLRGMDVALDLRLSSRKAVWSTNYEIGKFQT